MTTTNTKQAGMYINVQHFDDACFKWAILSALHPNVSIVSIYKAYDDKLNFWHTLK